jgi:hypothetical protein
VRASLLAHRSETLTKSPVYSKQFSIKGHLRIAGSEGFTQDFRSETLTPRSISIPDSYQSEGFTPVCRIAEVKPSLKAVSTAKSIQ